jgi:HTH-type transcriptional regulator / antitoxin MqsA
MDKLYATEVVMFQCHVCGNTKERTELVSEIFNIDGRFLLVEQIPAQVCTNCGEPTFSREVTERVRQMVHSEVKPVRSINLPVYAFVEGIKPNSLGLITHQA